MSQPYEPKVFFQVKLTGNAAKLILEKQSEKSENGLIGIGKARATQILLCEMYQLKHKR